MDSGNFFLIPLPRPPGVQGHSSKTAVRALDSRAVTTHSGDSSTRNISVASPIMVIRSSIDDLYAGDERVESEGVSVLREETSEGQCRGDGCSRVALSTGLCRMHGGRRVCTVDGCEKTVHAKGLCGYHYRHCGVDDCTNKVVSKSMRTCYLHSQAHNRHQENESEESVESKDLRAFRSAERPRRGVKLDEESVESKPVPASEVATEGQCHTAGCAKRALSTGQCYLHGGRKFCAMDGCEKTRFAKGLCYVHRQSCTVDGCTNKATANGLCRQHSATPNHCRVDGCMESVAIEGLCASHFVDEPRRRVQIDDTSVETKTVSAPQDAAEGQCQTDGCEERSLSAGRFQSHGARQLCAVDDCSKPLKARGLCRYHYQHCTVDGCINKAAAKGVCRRHTTQYRCQAHGCEAIMESEGLCSSHRVIKGQCQAEGCTTRVHSAGHCRMHGSRELCSVDGCKRIQSTWGICQYHRQRCEVDGCDTKIGSKKSRTCPRHSKIQRRGQVNSDDESVDPKDLRAFQNTRNAQHKVKANEKPVETKSLSASRDAPEDQCQSEGCTKRAISAGLCSDHGGCKMCTVDGCGRVSHSWGLCQYHRRHCTVDGCENKTRSKNVVMCRLHSRAQRYG